MAPKLHYSNLLLKNPVLLKDFVELPTAIEWFGDWQVNPKLVENSQEYFYVYPFFHWQVSSIARAFCM